MLVTDINFLSSNFYFDLQIPMLIIVADSILWTNMTEKMTPFEVITTIEGMQTVVKSNKRVENC